MERSKIKVKEFLSTLNKIFWRLSSACHQRTTQSISWRFVNRNFFENYKNAKIKISRMRTLGSFSAKLHQAVFSAKLHQTVFSAKLVQSHQTEAAEVGRWEEAQFFFSLFSSCKSKKVTFSVFAVWGEKEIDPKVKVTTNWKVNVIMASEMHVAKWISQTATVVV